jgi:hypothetical protein
MAGIVSRSLQRSRSSFVFFQPYFAPWHSGPDVASNFILLIANLRVGVSFARSAILHDAFSNRTLSRQTPRFAL